MSKAEFTKTEEKVVEVVMPKKELVLLKDLYKLRSYSGSEEPMRELIRRKLNELNVPFTEQDGNILGLNYPNKPLLNAHMDMVNTGWGYEDVSSSPDLFKIDNKACIRLYRKEESKVKLNTTVASMSYWDRWREQSRSSLPSYNKETQVSLGADDKNGIWVILSLLAERLEFNFAFFHGEEIGCVGSKKAMSNPVIGLFIERNCPYAITIDRRNSGDIIGWGQKYCITLDDRLETFSNKHGFNYVCASGLSSDAGPISQACEAVNISCGYYEPHTYREYTNLNELWNTRMFVKKILEEFTFEPISLKRLREHKGCKTPSYNETVSHWLAEKEAREKEGIVIDKTGKTITTSKTTAITTWKDRLDKSIQDKNVKDFLKCRDSANEGLLSWKIVNETFKKLSEEDQLEVRSKLEAGQAADVTLYCLSDKEVERHSKLAYNTDEAFMRFKCPECGEESTILVDDMADYFGDTWFDLDSVYDLNTDNACEILGICPHCTRDLDLKGVFVEALKKYKKEHAKEIEFQRNEYYMQTGGTYID